MGDDDIFLRILLGDEEPAMPSDLETSLKKIKYLELQTIDTLKELDPESVYNGTSYPHIDFKYSGDSTIKALKISAADYVSEYNNVTFVPKLYVEGDILRLKLEYNLKNRLQKESMVSDIERYFKNIEFKTVKFIDSIYRANYLTMLQRFDKTKIDNMLVNIADENLKIREKNALNRIFSLDHFKSRTYPIRMNDCLKKLVSNYEAGK